MAVTATVLATLLALAFGVSLWFAWRMRWERDRALDALAEARQERGVVARIDAMLRGGAASGDLPPEGAP